MKKIFPVIVVLITLSLLGLIALQVSWFKNLLIVQEQQLEYKIEKVGGIVSADLGKYVPSTRSVVPFDDIDPYNPSGRSMLTRFFSVRELRDRIQKVFNDNGLKHVNFEFAIISNGNADLQSPGYFEELQDTINNKASITPILTGSEFDSGLIPNEHVTIIVLDFQDELYQSLTWMILGAVLFTLIILTAFFLTVRTLLTQKKLSEIKSDFINNMTHEFKTPLATISLAVDALKNEKVQHDKEKMQYFGNIIKEENKRMNKHVETILQAALMDKQELKLNFKSLHAHDVITKVVDTFRLQLDEKSGRIELTLNAREDLINADEVHFTNLVSNLIDNAIKYSKDELAIRVYTHCTNKHFILRVEDNGIGMSKESVKRIFEKFFRAHTGNIHNVKGFGLGMSYVKTVVDAHKGRIRVDSTLGRGSVFTVEMPMIRK
ncbi:MAG: two-component sensor histidine kinase [Chitinophagaceae bacterium]|nr:two-component sensor histidine kinase [Chitinophagaceae bacterium]